MRAVEDSEDTYSPYAPTSIHLHDDQNTHRNRNTNIDNDANNNHSTAFLRMPLSCTSWRFLAFVLTVDVLWTVLSFSLAVFSVSVAVALFWLFPLGPAVVIGAATLWRFMAKVEIGLAPNMRQNISLRRVLGPHHDSDVSDGRTWCSVSGACHAMVDAVVDSLAWLSLLYFLVVRFVTGMFRFVWTSVFLGVSMGFMFNWLILATCPSDTCFQHIHSGLPYFMIRTIWGALLICLPLGYLMLCLTLRLNIWFVERSQALSRTLFEPFVKEEHEQSLLAGHDDEEGRGPTTV